MTKPIQLNDTVFFLDMNHDICYGIVIGMNLCRSNNHTMITLADVHPIEDPFDTKSPARYAEATVDQRGCFLSVSELKEHIMLDRKAKQDVYREQIRTVEDLMRFVLENDVSGKSFKVEYDDPDAIQDIENKRIVFVEKAEELLGIQNLPRNLPETEY